MSKKETKTKKNETPAATPPATKFLYTLQDTIPLMTSGDPYDRLRGEYIQCIIRKENLRDYMNKRTKENSVGILVNDVCVEKPDISLLRNQIFAMNNYAMALASRMMLLGMVIPVVFEMHNCIPPSGSVLNGAFGANPLNPGLALGAAVNANKAKKPVKARK